MAKSGGSFPWEPPGLKVKPPCFGCNIKVVLGGLLLNTTHTFVEI